VIILGQGDRKRASRKTGKIGTLFHRELSKRRRSLVALCTQIGIQGLSLFVFGATTPQWARASSFTRFLDHTQRRTTVGRTPLDEWSARRRDLYLTTHNTHNRQTPMPPVGFEPRISAGERPQTYALDRAATGTGPRVKYVTLGMSLCTNVPQGMVWFWTVRPAAGQRGVYCRGKWRRSLWYCRATTELPWGRTRWTVALGTAQARFLPSDLKWHASCMLH